MNAANPYLPLIHPDSESAIRQSLLTAVDKQPDAEARLQDLAGRYGLPVEAVRLQPQVVERQAKLDAVPVAEIAANLPATAGLLADPQKAALAYDDTHNLGALERGLQFLKNSGKALLSGLYGFGEGVAGQAEAGAELLSGYLTGPIADAGILPADIGAPLAQAMHELRRSQTAWREYLTPHSDGSVESGYYAGLQSLSRNLLNAPLALASGGPALALAGMALNTGGQSYGRARDAGAGPERALAYGAADASIEYGTELAPWTLLFKDVKAGTPFFRTLARQLAAEVPGEQAATALQDLNEWAVLHPEQTLDDYLAERPDAALQTLVATAVGSGGRSAVLRGVRALAESGMRRADGAEAAAEGLRAVSGLAADSKLLRRAPAVLKDFVDGIVRDSGADNLYLDAKAVADGGLAGELAEALPEAAAQLPAALAGDGEIRIPLSDYLVHVAPRPALADRLLGHLRPANQAFSKAGATDYLLHRAAMLQAETERPLAEEQAETDAARSRDAVKQAVLQRLEATGRFDRQVSEQYAALHAAFYAAMAEKLGWNAERLYAAYPLQVRSEDGGGAVPTRLSDAAPESNAAGVQAATETSGGNAGPRGSYDPQNRSITLLPGADLSTFLHESAHQFLDMQFDLAAQMSNEAAGSPADGLLHQPGKPVGSTAATRKRKTPADDIEKYLAKISNDDVVPGHYATTTKLGADYFRPLGTETVNTPEEAAQAFAYLGKYVEERFEALITDRKGKPLAVVGAMKGDRHSSNLAPETFVAESFRIKNAANIWFAHNHPGGEAVLSTADRVTFNNLHNLFFGTRIKTRGMFAIANGRGGERTWVCAEPPLGCYNPPDTAKHQPGDVHGIIRPAETVLRVPVVNLEYDKEGSLGTPYHGDISLEDLERFSGGKSGLLLVANNHEPVAFLALQNDQVFPTRERGRLDLLYRSLFMSNAQYVVIVNHGEFSGNAFRNLCGLLRTMQVRLWDIIDVADGKMTTRRILGNDEFILRSATASYMEYYQPGLNEAEANGGLVPPAVPGATPDGATAPFGTGRRQLLADVRILLDWFGVSDLTAWQRLDFAEKRRCHERFAQAFEAYLFEGRAPSPALRGPFERFKAWLLAVYRNAPSLHADLRDEIRGVFDRMLAGAEQTRQAEREAGFAPLFTDADQGGMSAGEFARYQTLRQAAGQDAATAVQNRLLADLRRLRGGGSRALRRAAKAAAAAEVRARPVYRAWAHLAGAAGGKLDAGAVQRLLPPGLAARFRRFAMLSESDGLHPDAAAEFLGWSSGDELLQALAAARPPQKMIRELSEAGLLAAHGGLATVPALRRAARLAVHRPLRAAWLAMEEAALAKAVGRAPLPAVSARRAAGELADATHVGHLQPERYALAEHRSALAAAAAFKAGDLAVAAAEKRRQLLNFYAYRAALHAQDQAEADLRELQASAVGVPGVPAAEAGQLRTLLARYGIGGNGRRAAPDGWLAAQANLGLRPRFARRWLQGKPSRPYRQLPVGGLRELANAAGQVVHSGLSRNRLFATTVKTGVLAARRALVAAVQHAPSATMPIPAGLPAAGQAARAWAQRLGGGRRGPLYRYLLAGAGQCAEYRDALRGRAGAEVAAVLQAIAGPDGFAGKGRYFSGLGRSFNREMRLAIALNTGSGPNLQRLLAAEGWSAEALQSVLDALDAEEWLAVQRIWDVFAALRPAFAALELRLYGREPAPVALLPRMVGAVSASGADMRLALAGGYYPMQPVRAEAGGEADFSALCFAGDCGSAAARPLPYSISALFAGLNRLVGELAWQAWRIDCHRLLASAALKKALAGRFGPDAPAAFAAALHAVPGDEAAALRLVDTAQAKLRQWSVAAGLAYRALGAAVLAQNGARLWQHADPEALVRAAADYLSDPQAARQAAAGQSALLHARLAVPAAGAEPAEATESAAFELVLAKAREISAVPLWLAVYRQAAAAGKKPGQCVAAADRALAAVPEERVADARRLFGEFYTFMQTATGPVPGLREAQRGTLAAEYLLVYALPAVLADGLRAVLPVAGAAAGGAIDLPVSTPPAAANAWLALAGTPAAAHSDSLLPLMALAADYAAAAGIAENLPSAATAPSRAFVAAFLAAAAK